MESDDLIITHNAETKRFEADLNGYPGVVEDTLSPGTMAFTHTEVAPEIEGRGVASALVKAGLDYARDKGLDVMPLCPFVAFYIRRNPEYKDLLKAGFNL